MIKIKVESVVTPTQAVRNRQENSRKNNAEGLPCYSIGRRYPDFNMLESFVEEYNTDIRTLKEGDVIIRDWQFGHLDNTGYRPYEVVEAYNGTTIIVTDGSGYHSICADPIITKNTYWHKLNTDYVKK